MSQLFCFSCIVDVYAFNCTYCLTLFNFMAVSIILNNYNLYSVLIIRPCMLQISVIF